ITGLAAGEVLSVQSGPTFTYTTTNTPTTTTTAPTTTTTTTAPTTTAAPTTTTTTTAPTTTAAPTTTTPGALAGNSANVTWSCTSSPCPWGSSLGNPAIVWPASLAPTNQRLGYTTSGAVYLPAAAANGKTVTINTGSATAYAGLPNATSHRVLGTISTGQSLAITGLAAGEVLSVQSGPTFTYTTTNTPTTTTTAPTTTTTAPDCTNPTACNPTESVTARWACNTPGCTATDWVGAVINWPSWAAYSTNGRSGSNSRTVYSTSGSLLYPYMGAWANGCTVTAQSGRVLIIEWQRGTNVWTETWLETGDTHVITLSSPQNGAMIEAEDFSSGFSVSLANCTPQPVPTG
ncbi:hypothetical protein VB775_10185, partial [Pseudanabaena sp. CCNP1317]